MAAPEAAGEIARKERASDTPRPTTAADTAPKADPTPVILQRVYYMPFLAFNVSAVHEINQRRRVKT